MKTFASGMGVLAAILAMAAGVSVAAAASASSSTRDDTRAGSNSGQPEVHIWINGEEVRPGDVGNLGDLPPHSQGDASQGGSSGAGQSEAYLGVNVGQPLPEGPGKPAPEGAQVSEVMPGSPAHQAGIAVDDRIVSIDGRRMRGPREVVEAVRAHKSGDRLLIVIDHGGTQIEKTVTLGERPRAAAPPGSPPGQDGVQPYLGVMVRPLTADTMEIAGIDHGVFISSLTDGSPVAKAGLLPGDAIASIDDHEVYSPRELYDLVRNHRAGDRLHVIYYRMGKRQETDVTLGAESVPERPRRGRGMPQFPEELYQQIPELREYLNRMRRQLEEGMPPQVMPQEPAPRPPSPEALPPMPPVQPSPPYDIGKDIGRILERLNRIERRLDDMEKRLDKLQK